MPSASLRHSLRRLWALDKFGYSLRVAIALASSMGLSWYLAEPSMVIPLFLGVIASALAETDDSWRGRTLALLVTLLCFSIAAMSVRLLFPYPPVFAVGLAAAAFCLVMLGALGERYGAIASATLILSVYTMIGVDQRGGAVTDFWHEPVLLVAGGMAALTLLQPDLGNSLALIILTLALAYLAGARVHHMALIAAAALPVVIALIAMKPYRWRRMVAFMDPWDDPRGIGFQIIQSFLALGSGGWLGVGLGDSKQKLFYLPEPYTDFIFSIIGEELGLVGTTAILTLFALLIWRGLRVGLRAPDAFGAYLALGLTIMLATQTLVNIGVVTGALPTKGLPLPFISFGGSALLMTMFSAGVLLNISQHGTGDRELYSRRSA